MRAKYEIGRAFVAWDLEDKISSEYPHYVDTLKAFMQNVWWFDITDRVRKQRDISFSFSNPYNEFQPSADDITIDIEDYDHSIERLTAPYMRRYGDSIYWDLVADYWGEGAPEIHDTIEPLFHYLETGEIQEFILLRISDYDTGEEIYLGVITDSRRKGLYPYRVLSIRAYWFPFKWLQKLKITLLPSDIIEFDTGNQLVLKGMIDYLENLSDTNGYYRIYRVRYPTNPDYSGVQTTLNGKISDSLANYRFVFALLGADKKIQLLFPRNPDDGSILIPSSGTYEQEVGGWKYLTDPAEHNLVKVLQDDEEIERWTREKELRISFGAARWKRPVNPFNHDNLPNYKGHYTPTYSTVGRRDWVLEYYAVDYNNLFYFGFLPRIRDIVWSIQHRINAKLIAPPMFRVHFFFRDGTWDLYSPDDRTVVLWTAEKSVYDMLSEICKYIDGRLISTGTGFYHILPRDATGSELELNPDWVEDYVEVNYEAYQDKDIIPDFGIEWSEQEKQIFRDYYATQKRRRLIYRLRIPLEIGKDVGIMDEVKADWLFTERYFAGHPIQNELRVIKKVLKLNQNGIFDKIELEVEQI